MELKHCAGCRCPDVDRVPEEIERLEAWCRERGIALVRGDCLRLGTASAYSGLAVQTLRNLSTVGALQFERVRGKAYITVNELARLVCEK